MQNIFKKIADRPRGHGLPPVCYTDEGFLQLEIEKLFRKEWHCLGRSDEIPVTGDFFTVDLVGEPLVVIRQADGEIEVLSNVCRHRGMPVAEGSGNCKKLRCPYHAWTYNIDGTLRNAPLVAKELLDKNCRLPVLPSRCWQGFVFASLDPQAEWPMQSLELLESHNKNYHIIEMHHGTCFSEVWQCNWKSLVENFVDGYHLSVVHPETLHHLTPTSLCKKLADASAFTAYTAKYADTAPDREHCHPSLSKEERRQSQLFCLFPSLIASLSADTLVYFALHPVGVNQVSVKWGVAVYESGLEHKELAERVNKWKKINSEDHRILKRLQTGLNSLHSTTGPLAADNYEGTLHDFHRYLTSKLESINQ